MATRPDTLTRPIDPEAHRRELTGYCYRMLGSGSEAEDAVQETMIRAWRHADELQSEAALRSWLYRIATNVCVDMLRSAQRRARPMELGGGPSTFETAALGEPLPESVWVQPVADARVLPEETDPAELAAARETVKLAFVAALQHLPPKQRAVLVLREVLRWKASEVAELLDTSVASVNSALQRARETLDKVAPQPTSAGTLEDDDALLLEKYVQAFSSYDVTSLVTLLAEDATFSMPPFDLWLVGREDVEKWMLGPGSACADNRLLTTQANGCPAVAIYKRGEDGGYHPFNLMVLEITAGKVTDVYNWLYPDLFPAFGLPTRIDE